MAPNNFEIQAIADKPSVYLFWHTSRATPLVAVNCQTKSDAPFPDSANIMQNLTGLTSSQDWSQDSWDQDSSKSSTDEDVQAVGKALAHFDEELWNFDMCNVKGGRPFHGVKFVAIGSNVDKRKRAGNLALALTVSYIQPAASAAWCQSFSSLAEKLHLAVEERPQGAAGLPEELINLEPEPAEPVPEELKPLMAYLDETDREESMEEQVYAPHPRCLQACLDEKHGSLEATKLRGSAQLREASVDSDCSEVILYRPESATSPSDAESAASSLPDAAPSWSPMSSADLERLRQGLERDSEDALTITTLGGEDTIQLGTDLDPVNAYNNLWAASKIKDEIGQILLTHDLAWRILDAENLGFTYGQRVRKKDKFFVEGVKRAVAHYLRDGCNVIVVGQRQTLPQDLAAEAKTGRCQVLVADNTDDVIILKKAFEKRCPVVSRDLFRKQMADLRIDPELRKWYSKEGAKLQVKFTFDEEGKFQPDHALPMPVLRPSQRRGCGQQAPGAKPTCRRVREVDV